MLGSEADNICFGSKFSLFEKYFWFNDRHMHENIFLIKKYFKKQNRTMSLICLEI